MKKELQGLDEGQKAKIPSSLKGTPKKCQIERLQAMMVYVPRQKYKTTLKLEEKVIVYIFLNYENQIYER